MAVSDIVSADPERPPVLARPPKVEGRLSLLQLVRRVQDSSIGIWSDEAYEAEWWESRVLTRHVVVANSPDAVRHVLLDNADNYHKTPIARAVLEPAIGRGLLTSEGDVWRRQRRIMAPSFQHKRIVAFVPPIIAATEALLARWAGLAAPVDMVAEMSGLTLKIISEIMFSAGDDPEIAKIGASVEHYQKTIRPSAADLLGLPRWWPRPALKRAARLFAESDRVIWSLIERRSQAGDPGSDLLGLLMAKPEGGDAALTPAEIRNQIATIITAGHETTSLALSWTFYLLSLHPSIEATLHAELDAVLGGRMPGFDDVQRLRYTRMVIDEALRLYPPAHTMDRQAIGPDKIGDCTLRAGSTVLISPWLLHRHRKWWRDPEIFDPERMAPERAGERHRYAYIPFGAGPRICIGASLALTEAVLILASIAQRLRPRLVEGAVVDPVGLITLRPRHGLPMRLERR
jgi:cytochrome P450